MSSNPINWPNNIAMVWAGALLGVSFLATPVKFQADGLSLPVALDVGRHTFAAFNLAEWTLCGLLVTVWWHRGALARSTAALCLVLFCILILQTTWLLPSLDARVTSIISGEMPTPSYHHTLYAALELLKLILLAAFPFCHSRAIRHQPHTEAE